MPDNRKSPLDQGNRSEGGTLSDDSGGFSIETTTMRLKSLRVRRTEKAEAALEQKASSNTDQVEKPRGDRPAGRVRHDERGMAVWDWAVATGEFATLSATHMMKKLEIADLEIDDHGPTELKLEASGRDKAGGFDPYNQRGSGKRQGEAAQRAGVTGAADRNRSAGADPLKQKNLEDGDK